MGTTSPGNGCEAGEEVGGTSLRAQVRTDAPEVSQDKLSKLGVLASSFLSSSILCCGFLPK